MTRLTCLAMLTRRRHCLVWVARAPPLGSHFVPRRSVAFRRTFVLVRHGDFTHVRGTSAGHTRLYAHLTPRARFAVQQKQQGDVPRAAAVQGDTDRHRRAALRTGLVLGVWGGGRVAALVRAFWPSGVRGMGDADPRTNCTHGVVRLPSSLDPSSPESIPVLPSSHAMHFTSSLLAAAAAFSSVNAASKGFNYGAFFGNQQAKEYVDFKYEFEAAKELPGTNGQFTSARLYTMIQHGTANSVISAIQAAIDTKTELLLGIWASAGSAVVDNEITALRTAISQYGSAFTDLVVGISVGSEDLYRITPTAIGNGETNPGAQPAELVNYIKRVRDAISGTGLTGKPVGHVDTWTAYDNSSNAEVIANLDFLGVDAYPFWEVEHDNSI